MKIGRLFGALCALALACACQSGEPPRPPSKQDLERVCPAAFLVATVECPAIAVRVCPGYERVSDCPAAAQVKAACRVRMREEFKKCL